MPGLETKEHKSTNDETWNHATLIQVLPNSSNLEHTQHHTCLFFLIRGYGCQRQPEGVLPPNAQQAVRLFCWVCYLKTWRQTHKSIKTKDTSLLLLLLTHWSLMLSKYTIGYRSHPLKFRMLITDFQFFKNEAKKFTPNDSSKLKRSLLDTCLLICMGTTKKCTSMLTKVISKRWDYPSFLSCTLSCIPKFSQARSTSQSEINS